MATEVRVVFVFEPGSDGVGGPVNAEELVATAVDLNDSEFCFKKDYTGWRIETTDYFQEDNSFDQEIPSEESTDDQANHQSKDTEKAQAQ